MLRAAHLAIKTASQDGYKNIMICTNSSYVVEAVCNAQNYQKSLQNRELMQGIHDLSKKIKVSVAYIKGHSGIRGNERANLMAKAGAKL